MSASAGKGPCDAATPAPEGREPLRDRRGHRLSLDPRQFRDLRVQHQGSFKSDRALLKFRPLFFNSSDDWGQQSAHTPNLADTASLSNRQKHRQNLRFLRRKIFFNLLSHRYRPAEKIGKKIGDNAHENGHRARHPHPEAPSPGRLGMHDCRTSRPSLGQVARTVASPDCRADPMDALLLLEFDRGPADTYSGH